MKCEQVRTYGLDYLDENLTASLREEVENHLQECPGCREMIAGLGAAWELLDHYPGVEPSEDFLSRTMASYTEERSRERTVRIIRRLAVAAAAAVLIGLSLVIFEGAPDAADTDRDVAVDVPAGSPAETEVIRDLQLVEDWELLQALGDDLDMAIEYEDFVALGGEEAL